MAQMEGAMPAAGAQESGFPSADYGTVLLQKNKFKL